MASISWQTGFPTAQGTSIVGKCNFTLGTGEGYKMAELVANKGATEYVKTMNPNPEDKTCDGIIQNLPTGSYDVTGKLTFNRADGSQGITNTSVASVTIC